MEPSLVQSKDYSRQASGSGRDGTSLEHNMGMLMFLQTVERYHALAARHHSASHHHSRHVVGHEREGP